jgi:hypothetical protein
LFVGYLGVGGGPGDNPFSFPMPVPLPSKEFMVHAMPALGFLSTYGTRFIAYVAKHTGVPAVVVAALGVVISMRVVKRTLRLLVEVSLVTAVLLALTYAGVLRF